MAPAPPLAPQSAGDGVYAYRTRDGVRYRFVFRRSDGTISSRRGFLIGTGARVSEAVANRWADLDLDEGVSRIYRQRACNSNATRVTKGKRFRSGNSSKADLTKSFTVTG